MNDHKGRALGYVLAVLSSWILVRIFLLNGGSVSNEQVQAAFKRQPNAHPQQFTQLAQPSSFEPFAKTITNIRPVSTAENQKTGSRMTRMPDRYKRLTQYLDLMKERTEIKNLSRLPDAKPFFPAQNYVMAPASTALVQTNPELSKTKFRKRARFYAYSFWRADAGANFVTNLGEFAGSQSGLIGELPIRLDHRGNTQLALIFRSFAAPFDKTATEIGAGIQWRPSPKLPVNVAIEARFKRRYNRNLVTYFVIAPKPLKLSPKVSLSTYAQLGAFIGKNPVQFFDGNARLDFTLLNRPRAKISVGPLLSANIQNDKHRVEFGPSIAVDLGLGKTNFRLSADYRVQAAGDEARSSGPTFTASTSF